MSEIKLHASNFKCYGGSITLGKLSLRTPKHRFLGEEIKTNTINILDVESRDTNKKIGGSIGWGIAGDIALGPVGAVAGLVLGGNKKKTTFILELNDGRRIVATANSNEFMKFHADFLVGDKIDSPKNSTENTMPLPSSESQDSVKPGVIKIIITSVLFFIGCFLSWAFYDISEYKVMLFPIVIIFIPLYAWWKGYLIREFGMAKYLGEVMFLIMILLIFNAK